MNFCDGLSLSRLAYTCPRRHVCLCFEHVHRDLFIPGCPDSAQSLDPSSTRIYSNVLRINLSFLVASMHPSGHGISRRYTVYLGMLHSVNKTRFIQPGRDCCCHRNACCSVPVHALLDSLRKLGYPFVSLSLNSMRSVAATKEKTFWISSKPRDSLSQVVHRRVKRAGSAGWASLLKVAWLHLVFLETRRYLLVPFNQLKTRYFSLKNVASLLDWSSSSGR